MARPLHSSIEALESRIAPAALTIMNPFADIVAGIGKTGATVDLGHLFDDVSAARTHVEFLTNFDMDPGPGFQPGKIVLELFDDKTPLTVQNFLGYVNNVNAKGDYDGVIFSRLVQGFVLQTGGFDVTAPNQHIPVAPEVHNEANSSDPELQNTLGTVALAKVGSQPNSGTSEFFFNLADNRSNLDSQNGGFTVFGKVISGMDVINAIAAQPTAPIYASPDASSPNAGTPYQGDYDPNPDHNLLTPSPALKPNQAIQIVSATVVAPTDSPSDNIRYAFSVTDHTTGVGSSVVIPKLVGDTLELTYAKGKSGVADVKITATPLDAFGHPDGDAVSDTFTVSVLPNLTVHSGGDTLQTLIGPDDTATAKVKLTNTGAASLVGKYDLKFFLVDTSSATAVPDPVGQILGKTLNLPSGQSISLTGNLSLPESFKTNTGDVYQLTIQASPSTGNTTQELFADDNTSLDGSQHNWTNVVGKVVSNGKTIRNESSITYTDAGTHLVTVSLTGGGYGIFSPAANGGTDFGVVGSTAKTNVSFKVADINPDPFGPPTHPHATLNNVIVFEDAATNGLPVGSLSMGSMNLSGSFVATGSAKSIVFGDILDTAATHQFLIGGSTALAKTAPAITLGTVHDTTFGSGVPVKSLTAAAWLDTGDQDSISAPALGKLSIAGNLQSDVTVNANTGDSRFVNTNPVTTPSMTLFKVGGLVDSAYVKIAASVGTVDIGALSSSRFLVGSDSVPSGIASFDQVRTIASFIVRGVQGQPFAISDSEISAAKFTSIRVKGSVETANGTDDFGFVADSIGSYLRTGHPLLKHLTSGTFDREDQYSVQLV